MSNSKHARGIEVQLSLAQRVFNRTEAGNQKEDEIPGDEEADFAVEHSTPCDPDPLIALEALGGLQYPLRYWMELA